VPDDNSENEADLIKIKAYDYNFEANIAGLSFVQQGLSW